MAIFSAEGGVFSMMAGRYSDSPSLDVYLKAHAGDEIRVDRKGRSSEQVTDPALTLGLAVQPAVLDALAEKPMLRGTGLLARFLYALPESRLGQRSMRAQPMTDSIRASYADALRNALVLQDQGGPIVLKPSPAAFDLWLDFASWVEPHLAELGDFHSIRDWAGKLPGAVARISGVLSIVSISGYRRPFQESISINLYIDEEAMAKATAIGRYLVPHAKAAFSAMGTDERTQGAKAILACIRRKGLRAFSRSELHRLLRGSERFQEAESLEGPLQLLADRNFIRLVSQPRTSSPGRPRSQQFEVSPLWGRPPGEKMETMDNNPPSPAHGREPGEDDA
jgi:hypothetical protein